VTTINNIIFQRLVALISHSLTSVYKQILFLLFLISLIITFKLHKTSLNFLSLLQISASRGHHQELLLCMGMQVIISKLLLYVVNFGTSFTLKRVLL
jgi:hypothetical protein